MHLLDPPATIAVLGSGPVGLEAALYGRFLGYDVKIFEQGTLCNRLLLRDAEKPLAAPFRMNSSPLGLAALTGQNPDVEPPAGTATLTVKQWFDQYLRPLAESDLLADHVLLHQSVMAIRRNPTNDDSVARFQLDVASDSSADEPADGPTTPPRHGFDAVIDATGTLAAPASCEAVEQTLRPLSSALSIRWDETAGCCEAMAAWLATRGASRPPSPTTSFAGSVEAGLESALETGEPYYFVIGSKSFGHQHDFRFLDGLAQIRVLFASLMGRATLNLYETFQR